MRFKKGDKVRVRKWEDMEKEFGKYGNGNLKTIPPFFQEMRTLCGKVSVIDSTNEKGMYSLIEFEEWTFSDSMLEPVEPKYKVGDYVFTKCNKEIEGEIVSYAMSCGVIDTVFEEDLTYNVKIECDPIHGVSGRKLIYKEDELELAFLNLMFDGAKCGILKTDKVTIKDSGDRTQFETGAVRDLHAGKGRMDLLPFHAILELSKHCENGALKYEEHNVDKGIPQHSLIDSGMRHLFKYASGYTDEDHLLAALWNIAFAVNQRTTHPELIDVPWKGEK